VESENIEQSYSEHLDTSNELKNAIKKVDFDLATDYAEIGLDSFVTDEVLKEIPIVKTLVGLTRGALKVREIHFAKKLMTFLKHFHSGKLSEDKMNGFKREFEENTSYRERVLEQIMIYNDRFIEVNKSEIYANLFLAHLNGKYNWESFLSLSSCLEKLNLSTIDFFHEMAKESKPFYRGYSQFDDNVALLITAGLIQQWGTHIQITAHGIYLYFYGILGDTNHTFDNPAEETNNHSAQQGA